MSEVREWFAKYAHTYAKVLEYRGTEDPFPAFVATYRSDLPPGDPESLVEYRPLHPPGHKDYSLTNSRSHYLAVCKALISGEDALADQLALSIWDPPDASYLGANSVVCTTNEQHLAYALREMFKGDADAAHSELIKVRPRKLNDRVASEGKMLRGLIDEDAAVFLDGLRSLLALHARDATRDENRTDSSFFICIPALGLCKLALRRRLLQREQFPQGNQFLPIDLIASP